MRVPLCSHGILPSRRCLPFGSPAHALEAHCSIEIQRGFSGVVAVLFESLSATQPLDGISDDCVLALSESSWLEESSVVDKVIGWLQQPYFSWNATAAVFVPQSQQKQEHEQNGQNEQEEPADGALHNQQDLG